LSDIQDKNCYKDYNEKQHCGKFCEVAGMYGDKRQKRQDNVSPFRHWLVKAIHRLVKAIQDWTGSQ
jgi:hypothetical protein